MPRKKQPPAGLKAAGKALWRSIVADLDDGWEFDAREYHLLKRAGRCADELAELEAVIDRDGIMVEGSRGQRRVNPAIAEARQLRLVQLRLLGAVEMVDPKGAVRSATPAQARARKAAETRWDMERAKHG